jgi:predicted amidohydrolase
MTFKESLTLTPGEAPTVVDTAAGRLGVGICYDIRFPELAMLYAKRGVQVLVYPGGRVQMRQNRVAYHHDWHYCMHVYLLTAVDPTICGYML